MYSELFGPFSLSYFSSKWEAFLRQPVCLFDLCQLKSLLSTCFADFVLFRFFNFYLFFPLVPTLENLCKDLIKETMIEDAIMETQLPKKLKESICAL